MILIIKEAYALSLFMLKSIRIDLSTRLKKLELDEDNSTIMFFNTLIELKRLITFSSAGL